MSGELNGGYLVVAFFFLIIHCFLKLSKTVHLWMNSSFQSSETRHLGKVGTRVPLVKSWQLWVESLPDYWITVQLQNNTAQLITMTFKPRKNLIPLAAVGHDPQLDDFLKITLLFCLWFKSTKVFIIFIYFRI